MAGLHPDDALAKAGLSLPVIPACEHYAGSEKLISKSLALFHTLGPVFDLTCDCEDGAAAGDELRQAQMIADTILSAAQPAGRIGIRLLHPGHEKFLEITRLFVRAAGHRIAYFTIPKVADFAEAQSVASSIAGCCRDLPLPAPIPLHVLIETQKALRDVWQIAALDGLEVLDFGLLDFISDHSGAIPAACMQSPLQFEHRLLIRAKTEITAAALANGVIPAHNICTDFKNAETVFKDAKRAHSEFGFLRMWSVHPAQIEPIVRAMLPDTAELSRMQEILLAAFKKDWAPMAVEGKLHDRASYRFYWDSVRRARIGGAALLDEAERLFF